ncbi:cytochrome B [Pseudoalteromonas sp. NBT06-2]|uniref:cytochrome b n=1 Tax=Pseudoalteromonas sp. NBT06-2 TaxID=2025950 RepID=UPI000BA614FF|nr:cytochrome b [Pseudoalteromonas sp. NBT06-2]PAJ73730.1 cytochrome B [Pseudoalteromonas sp. NBT06-2]
MFKNTSTSYGYISIIIHWVMALIIFCLFGLGLYMVELSYYDAWYKGSLDLHKSIGMVLVALLLTRICWTVFNIKPKSAVINASKFETKSADYAHIALYLLMTMLMLSGYLISTADGRDISVFGVISIPAFSIAIENQEDIAGSIHNISAWSLVILASAHGLAAIKHHFINKNDTLKRMLKVF